MANQEAPSASIPPSSVFSLLTSNEREAQFQEVILRADPRPQIHCIASMMVSNLDTFMDIIKNKNGRERIQQLFGKSHEADVLFYTVIRNHFVVIMCEQHSWQVVAQAMMVFDQEKIKVLYDLIYMHSLNIACTKYGCIVIRKMLTKMEDHNPFKTRLLGLILCNVPFLSHDFYGNYVVQQLLKMDDVRITEQVSVMLQGYCVQLSFNKQGSVIVEMLLAATAKTITRVVYDLLTCDGNTLVGLARSPFGKFVVARALKATQEKNMGLFWSLRDKLMLFRERLLSSYAYNIVHILDNA